MELTKKRRILVIIIEALLVIAVILQLGLKDALHADKLFINLDFVRIQRTRGD